MRKNVILLVIVMLLLAGCEGKFDLSKLKFGSEESSAFEVDYHKGTEGLKMNFRKNLPPKEIYIDDKFQLGLELRNKGTWPIRNGKLYVSGYTEEMVMDSIEETFSLAAKDENNPEGGYEIIDFTGTNYGLPSTKKSLFIINACYGYKTEASVTICIDPDVRSKKLVKSACNVETVSVSGGQGAPVAVTKVEPRVIPSMDKVYAMKIDIYVKNVGRGVVRNNSNCGGYPVVNIEEVTVSDYSTKNRNSIISCQTPNDKEEGKILVLEPGKDNKITCTISLNRELGSFVTPLTVTMNYMYAEVLESSILVKEWES